MKKPKPKYRRILLKISGEFLGGAGGIGICAEAIHEMARQFIVGETTAEAPLSAS